MTRERSRGLARGCASPPDRYQGSAKIFHDVFPVFFFSSGRGTRGRSRDFPLRVFPHVSVARRRGAVAGPGMSGAGGRIPPGSLSMLLPSAGLFQRLIIYRRLCGQLYRGSYCLIELLDSSAAKTGTEAGKKKKRIPPPLLVGQPGKQGQHNPLGKIRLSRGNLGCCHPHPTSLPTEGSPRERCQSRDAPGG